MAIQTADGTIDQEAARECLNGLSTALRALQNYDLKNPNVSEPVERFVEAASTLLIPDKGVSLGLKGDRIVINEVQVQHHFSIVEAKKLVLNLYALGYIEQIVFRTLDRTEVERLFVALAQHLKQHFKPAAFALTLETITIVALDPEKALGYELKPEDYQRTDFLILHLFTMGELIRQTLKEQNETKRKEAHSSLMRHLIESAQILTHYPIGLLRLAHLNVSPDAVITQTARTTLLSMAFANHVGFTPPEVMNVGMLALTYLRSKNYIPKSTIEKVGELTPQDRKEIELAHERLILEMASGAHLGVGLLEKLLSLFEADSTGGKSAKSVRTIESRILRMANQYVALSLPQIFRDAFLPHQAVTIMRPKNENPVDRMMANAFIDFIGFYPITSLVRARSGELGVVVSPHGEKRHSPVIRLVEELQTAQLKQVDTGLHKMSITELLDPETQGVRPEGYLF